jgi:putative transposase
MQMFRKQSDFEAFERVMVEAHQRQPIRILSYCVLSNHWGNKGGKRFYA